MITEQYQLTQEVQDILSVHEALWNKEPFVMYHGEKVSTFTPSHEGFTSAILKNSKGKPFQWVTQNLNKNSYGTMRIIRARAQGEDHRITWIIDNSEAQFKYVGRVESIRYPDGKISSIIERYIGDQTEIIYNSDPKSRKVRSEY